MKNRWLSDSPGKMCIRLGLTDTHFVLARPITRVREIVLSLAGHFKLFAGHLIEFNYSSSPDIFKIRWTCPASPANFAYSAMIFGAYLHLCMWKVRP